VSCVGLGLAGGLAADERRRTLLHASDGLAEGDVQRFPVRVCAIARARDRGRLGLRARAGCAPRGLCAGSRIQMAVSALGRGPTSKTRSREMTDGAVAVVRTLGVPDQNIQPS
jgi:hypothetical protein